MKMTDKALSCAFSSRKQIKTVKKKVLSMCEVAEMNVLQIFQIIVCPALPSDTIFDEISTLGIAGGVFAYPYHICTSISTLFIWLQYILYF